MSDTPYTAGGVGLSGAVYRWETVTLSNDADLPRVGIGLRNNGSDSITVRVTQDDGTIEDFFLAGGQSLTTSVRRVHVAGSTESAPVQVAQER